MYFDGWSKSDALFIFHGYTLYSMVYLIFHGIFLKGTLLKLEHGLNKGNRQDVAIIEEMMDG